MQAKEQSNSGNIPGVQAILCGFADIITVSLNGERVDQWSRGGDSPSGSRGGLIGSFGDGDSDASGREVLFTEGV